MNVPILEEILDRIQHIEKRPKMYGLSDSYESLASLISGYFLGLDTSLKLDLNKQFWDWIQHKANRGIGAWDDYILEFMAGNDEGRAKEILFGELKAFLEHLIDQ